jgi:hypothetical protein
LKVFLLFIPLISFSFAEFDWVAALGGKLERNPNGAVSKITLRGTWVTDSDLDALSGLPHLVRLDLSHTRITDQGMLRLKQLQNLTELDLYYAEQITDEGMAALKGWKKLERLNLRGTKITDTTLALLAGINALVFLDIGYAQVTDSGLQYLSSLKGLREVAFGGNKLTENGLQVLYSLPGLTHLDLSGRQRTDSGLWFVSVTDFGIDPVAALGELRDLNLSGTQISARGLEKLSKLDKLEKLNLYGARRIGDDAIPNLSAFPRLLWLDLKDTGVSKEGIERLRAAKPNVTVVGE